MTNAISLQDSTVHVEHRGAALDQMLKDERWTRRKVAMAIGATPTYINARMNGQVDLSFSDIEVIAPLLRMTGAELFVALQDVEVSPAPQNDPDPNVHPSDYKRVDSLAGYREHKALKAS